MIQGLSMKVEAEGKTEAVTFTKFKYWCTNSKKTLKGAIKESEDKIETLTESINGKLEEEQLLQSQIDDLVGEVSKHEAAGGEADKIRGEMVDIYTKVDGNFKATIKAIEDAISFLEKADAETDGFLLAQKKVAQVVALVQYQVSDDDLSPMRAFMVAPEPRPEMKVIGEREKHVKKYAFKSSSVIEMLKKLRLKFQDENLAATKDETNSVNAYNLAKNARDEAIKQANLAKDEKTVLLGEAKGDRADMEGQRGSAQDELKDDSKALQDTTKACLVKTSEWNERSETRKQELEAMKAAIDILAKAGGVRTDPPTNPVPPPSPVKAMLIETAVDPKVKAVQLLRASAAATHSGSLERMAQEISAAKTGHFDEVINMIQKMIFHLMDEQREEDNHKNWCDEEVKKTDVSMKNKADKMLELDMKIKAAQARITVLSTEIKDANEMAATISAHMAEATDIRKIGKQENEVAIKDAKEAQEALSNAISVLESFYKDSGMVKKEAWELIQRGVKLPATPATWDSAYTGVADPINQPAGIIAVLKTVSADFAKMESDTLAQEETDDQIYDEDMSACEVEKARRMRESKEKVAERKRQTEKAASLTSSHKTVAGQKESVEQYLKDLQHACVDGDSTYDERKASRTKEIDALKQAQTILADAFEAKPDNKPAASSLMGLRGGQRIASA